MPPRVALILCSCFVLSIFLRDLKKRRNVTSEIWIPFIWIMIIASRPVELWLNPEFNSVQTGGELESGSLINKIVFLALILIGTSILIRRRICWSYVFRKNILFLSFFAYTGLSILWSDFPEVAFKRWIRFIGSVVMILIILTEYDPYEAMRAVFRRCAYILIPFSILLIKYYRQLGVIYNHWTGDAMFAGVTTDKNALGRLCLVSGLFLVSEFFDLKNRKRLFHDKKEIIIQLIIVILIIWLLKKSGSATSLGTFLIGFVIFSSLGLTFIKKNIKRLTHFFLLGFLIIIVLEYMFNLSEIFVTVLGRDLTFTDRTFIWHDLMNMDTKPLLGYGFGSFWLGDRVNEFWRLGWYGILEAHNGYLEIYLDLGIVGLCLIAAIIISSYKNITKQFLNHFDNARTQFAFLLVFLIYNITESAFRESSLIFFVFLIISINCEVRENYRAKIVN